MVALRRRSAWWVMAVFILVPACGTAPHAGPEQPATGQAGAPHALWLPSVQMTSASDGWAVAEVANPGNPLARLPVLLTRTSDGGRTWTDVTPAGAGPMLSTSNAAHVLNAPDGERAYFAVTASTVQSESAANTTVLFATDDGGRTWTESAPLRTASQVAFVSFADAGHGWLLMTEGAAAGSNPVQVFRTADGGLHWSLAASSPPPGTSSDVNAAIPAGCDKTGITFPATTTGWLTSLCNAVSPDAFLVSRDGGTTWAAQQLPVPLGVNGIGADLSGPQFTGGKGFLTVGQYGGTATLLVTADLGQTWRRLPLPAGAGPYPQVRFFDPAKGVLVPAGPQDALGAVFYTTSDGGQTWTAVPQGTHFTQPGANVGFVSQRTGFAWFSGADGQSATPPSMYRTTDSGRTWQSFTPDLS